MKEMFDLYPQPTEYTPDNRPRPWGKGEITIMAGETAEHSFEIPFNVDEVALDFDILYKLGLNVIVVKNKKACSMLYSEKWHKTMITCTLGSYETMLFKNTLLDCNVQIRFLNRDLTTSYTEVYKVTLLDSLDVEDPKPPVPPQVITGFGYTED